MGLVLFWMGTMLAVLGSLVMLAGALEAYSFGKYWERQARNICQDLHNRHLRPTQVAGYMLKMQQGLAVSSLIVRNILLFATLLEAAGLGLMFLGTLAV